jgi:hypothetical protein
MLKVFQSSGQTYKNLFHFIRQFIICCAVSVTGKQLQHRCKLESGAPLEGELQASPKMLSEVVNVFDEQQYSLQHHV